jgi:LmbE family N-acetylglucosaminyl deacetylase
VALKEAAPGAPSSTGAPAGLPAFSARTRLLVVAPHPDDETIATGLLIQQVRAAGGEVRILLLTAGDNNPWPQRWLERRLRIGAADRRRWGHRRHAEMLRALDCLDVPVAALQTLGWPDMGVTDLLLEPGNEPVAAMAAVVRQFRPSLIAAPALDDRHPDHGSAHVLVRLALAGEAEPPPLLAYLVHGHARTAAAIEIHGTAAQVANKRAALAAHHSQMALSGGRLRRLAARPERYVPVSGTPARSDAALCWQPSAWLGSWLRLSTISSSGKHSWRWREAPVQRDSHGRYHLSAMIAAEGGPLFARLALTLPSLWIFDRWGWCECADRGAAMAMPLAPVD